MKHEDNCFLSDITHHCIFPQSSDAPAHINLNLKKKKTKTITEAVHVQYRKPEIQTKKTKKVNIPYVPIRHEHW